MESARARAAVSSADAEIGLILRAPLVPVCGRHGPDAWTPNVRRFWGGGAPRGAGRLPSDRCGVTRRVWMSDALGAAAWTARLRARCLPASDACHPFCLPTWTAPRGDGLGRPPGQRKRRFRSKLVHKGAATASRRATRQGAPTSDSSPATPSTLPHRHTHTHTHSTPHDSGEPPGPPPPRPPAARPPGFHDSRLA